MSTVFTILNCGTNFDRSKNDIIATLAGGGLVGKENTAWMINAGPGTQGAANRTDLGTAAGLLAASPLARIPQIQAASIALDKTAIGLGAVAGLGMGVTIDASVETLRRLPSRPHTINMVGWSRGAVECIATANRLRHDKDLARCPLSLFLIDPVPGPWTLNHTNWREEFTQIPTSVRNCWVVVMESDERLLASLLTQLLKPFVKYNQDGQGPHQLFYMPGRHYSGVEWSYTDQPQWKPSYNIVCHLCAKFLRERGTPLSKRVEGWLCSDQHLCTLYALLKLWILKNGRVPNRRHGTIDNKDLIDRYFVNEHNRRLFKLTFPYLKDRLGSSIPAREDATLKKQSPVVHKLIHYYDSSSHPVSIGSRALRSSV